MDEQKTERKTVTLAEVAGLAGVSRMTASKVMRNTGSISKATQERVRNAAAELGYVPNRLAGSLSSKSSDIVAVVLPSINDLIFGEVVSGINEILRPRGYITFIGETQFDSRLEEEILRTVLSLHPAGIILTGGIARSDIARRMLQNWRRPTIQIWDDMPCEFNGTIGPNHAEAGRAIAGHFKAQNYQAPAYIGAELHKDLCAARRFEAFKSTLTASGLEPRTVIDADLPRQKDTGRILVERLMRAHPETDAIYCLNDAMALGALAWLHKQGYDVPSRIAVAGFNGTSALSAVRTRLTTVHVERRVLGQAAANSIIDLLAGDAVEAVRVLPGELVLGNTS